MTNDSLLVVRGARRKLYIDQKRSIPGARCSRYRSKRRYREIIAKYDVRLLDIMWNLRPGDAVELSVLLYVIDS
jgi:hypothetical protein